MISTYTKEFPWRRKKPKNPPDFEKINKCPIAKFF
jgi:hypothetical protein